MDRTSEIFGNKIDGRTVKSAEKSKRKFLKKYGDDSDVDYKLGFERIPALSFMDVQNVVLKGENERLEPNAVIVGNIRMGFGHYRISIAMASCAKALGYKPYWLDFASFDSTGSKMIREQNNLYSLASKISQKSRLFNHFVWEPLNSEGFKKLTYNAKDQKNSELLVPILKRIPKDTPFIATHVWPAQGAVHAGMTKVVNAIPDNWPMALHLAQGAVHTVQTPFAYLGYKMLNGFAKTDLKGIPENQLKMTGHYVDHELVCNLENDNQRRVERAKSCASVRFLLTVGGAGAGFDMFLNMVKHLLLYVKEKKAVLFINFGDHKEVYEKMCSKIDFEDVKTFFDEYDKLKEFVEDLKSDKIIPSGIYAVYNSGIFEAVYSTNLLMSECDWLVTKPSELAYYPIPKIFMRHIGGHEVYGAVHAAEFGDGTFECAEKKSINRMIDRVLEDKEIFVHMVEQISKLKTEGYYDGAYQCVKLAVGKNSDL